MVRRMKDQYRRFSFLSDVRGMKVSIGELFGWGKPKQPRLNKKYNQNPNDPVYNEEWFISALNNKVNSHPENSMEYPFYGERIFEEPLVSFIPGDDPIFNEFKKVIGPYHLTPEEVLGWLAKKNGVQPPDASEVSVVSFILPLVKPIKEANAEMNKWPAEQWAQTRLLGEGFIPIMAGEITEDLMNKGILATVPDVTSLFRKKRYPSVGWASHWSQRHIAYAAGLGTFGMHDFLITERGATHCIGSFVVNLRLEQKMPRKKDIHEYCLHYQGKKCLQCSTRCPVEAININGHDKEACSKHLGRTLWHCNKNYHIFIYGCGLCSVGVPCSSGIPAPLKKNK